MTINQLQTQPPPQGSVVGKLRNPLVDDGDPRPLWRHMHIARLPITDDMEHEQEQYAVMLQAIASRLIRLDPTGRHRAVSEWLLAEAGKAA